jgi:hypothetical protein
VRWRICAGSWYGDDSRYGGCETVDLRNRRKLQGEKR